jgi:hypothetical protein
MRSMRRSRTSGRGGSGTMTWQFATKTLVSVAVIVVASELAKRTSGWAAIVASLPLTSLLVFVWLYVETGDTQRVASLSQGIFWLVLASLPLFAMLSMLLRSGWSFWASLTVACAATLAAYSGLLSLLMRLGLVRL